MPDGYSFTPNPNIDAEVQAMLKKRIDAGELVCPRDAGHLTELYSERRTNRGVRPDEVTGYRCSNGHDLNPGEKPLSY